MADNVVYIYQFDDVSFTGTEDPFQSNNLQNDNAIGTSTITVAEGSTPIAITIRDDDPTYEDADSGQVLGDALTTINGSSYGEWTSVETEYSYVVRPTGSLDPADNFTIYVVEVAGNVVGIASDGKIVQGQAYEIIPGGSHDPTVPYADLTICFAARTMIATPHGARPIETLRAGDLVLTSDNGVRQILWVGCQHRTGIKGHAPVHIPAGSLGNEADLWVSSQHRMLVTPSMGFQTPARDEILLPAKALIGQRGIRSAPRLHVVYYHILLEQHDVVFANGIRSETMYPGPMALKALRPHQRAEVRRLMPDAFGADATPTPARTLIRPGEWRRFVAQLGA